MRAKAKPVSIAEALRLCRAHGMAKDETILGGVRGPDVRLADRIVTLEDCRILPGADGPAASPLIRSAAAHA